MLVRPTERCVSEQAFRYLYTSAFKLTASAEWNQTGYYFPCLAPNGTFVSQMNAFDVLSLWEFLNEEIVKKKKKKYIYLNF